MKPVRSQSQARLPCPRTASSIGRRERVAGLGLAGHLMLGLALAACRATPPAPVPPAAPVGVSPLGDNAVGPGGGSDGDAARAPAGPVATWTPVPPGAPAFPGGADFAPSPGGAASGPAAGLAAAPAPAGGDIPVPTARPSQAVPDAGPPATDPDIVRLMAMVQPARLAADVNRLVGFGTRHALSDAAKPDHGVGAARDWLLAELKALDGRSGQPLVAEFDEFDLNYGGRATRQKNVIATLPGIGLEKSIVYVTAHYDSRVEDINNGTADAPGADDNASGTALLLELARVLGARHWDATLRLAAFAAEEEGLAGSKHHAAAADRLGLPIIAVFNNDIVGSSHGQGKSDGAAVRAFSDGPEADASRRLARYAAAMAARYGPLNVQVIPQADRADRAGDHLSFSALGFSALQLIEATEDLSRQHNPRDTTDRLDYDYLAKVARLNVALAGNLALAPAAPTEAPELAPVSGAPDRLSVRWPPPDGSRVAGTFVAWRAGSEPAYREVIWAGGGTAFELAGLPAEGAVRVSLAAADDRGHMSLFGPEAARP